MLNVDIILFAYTKYVNNNEKLTFTSCFLSTISQACILKRLYMLLSPKMSLIFYVANNIREKNNQVLLRTGYLSLVAYQILINSAIPPTFDMKCPTVTPSYISFKFKPTEEN